MRINWKTIELAVNTWAADQLAFCWYTFPDSLPVSDQYAVIQVELEKQGIRINWGKMWSRYFSWLYVWNEGSEAPFAKIKRLCREYRI